MDRYSCNRVGVLNHPVPWLYVGIRRGSGSIQLLFRGAGVCTRGSCQSQWGVSPDLLTSLPETSEHICVTPPCPFNLKSCIHTSKCCVLKCILGLPTAFICKNAQKFCAHVKQRMVVGNKGSGYF